MDSDTRDITTGLDVYGSDGSKIGSVAKIWPAGMQYSGASAGDAERTDNFSGTLGDESRVVGGPTARASGSLGDESRVGGANAAETLGDQAAGTGLGNQPMGTAPNASPGYAGQGSPLGYGGEIDEVDVVVVEEVPADMGGYGTGQSGANSGYFEVDQGGILGIGTKHLYVPFDAVQNIIPGDRVVLSYSKDEADTLFENQPDFLNAGS